MAEKIVLPFRKNIVRRVEVAGGAFLERHPNVVRALWIVLAIAAFIYGWSLWVYNSEATRSVLR